VRGALWGVEVPFALTLPSCVGVPCRHSIHGIELVVAGSSAHPRGWPPSAGILDLVSLPSETRCSPSQDFSLIGLSLRVLVGLYQKAGYASLR